MNEILKRLTCRFWRRPGRIGGTFRRVGSQPKVPAADASAAPPASPDHTGIGFEELPPESAWVELSRSSWF
jgi:hypothetical protein